MSPRLSSRLSSRPHASLESLEGRALFAATSLDPSFGGDGMAFTPTPATIGRVEAVAGGGHVAAYQPPGRAGFRPGDVPDAVVVRPNGTIDVIGTAVEGQTNAFALARFLGDSTPTPADQTYQAEAARVSGATVARAHAGYTGTGYVDYANASGDFIEWTIQVPGAGTYDLDFRFANGSSSARILKIDGSSSTSAIQFTRTGSWSNWQTAGARAVFAAGTHTVRLTAIGQSGPNIDSLRVRAAGRPPSTPQTLQAEQAEVRGAAFSRSHTGYTGTGYVDFAHASGDSIEWAVTLAETRQYVLEFRYANGGSADRPLLLIVDRAVTDIAMPFAPTGSWNTWRVQSATVTLTAGTHSIRLFASGAGGGNIDALTVR